MQLKPIRILNVLKTPLALFTGSVKRSGLFIRTSCPVPCSTFECGYEETPVELRKKIEMAQKKLQHSQEDHQNDNNPQTTG